MHFFDFKATNIFHSFQILNSIYESMHLNGIWSEFKAANFMRDILNVQCALNAL